MTNKTGLVAFLALLLALSCARNPMEEIKLAPDDGLQEITILATIDPSTKTALDDHTVVWEEGDQIYIYFFYPAGNSHYLQRFTIVAEDVGKSTARFTGSYAPGCTYYAMYPTSAYAAISTDYLKYNIPSVQQYRPNSFGRGANLSVATVTDLTQPICFTNTGGLLKLTFRGSGKSLSRIVLTAPSSEYLSGVAYLAKDFSSNPTTNFISATSTTNWLTLDCGEGAALTPEGTDFYFYVPYGRLGNGFTVEAYDTDGWMMRVQAPRSEQNRIKRSDIKAMPPLDYVPSVPTSFVQKSVPGIYNDLSHLVLETAFVSPEVQCGVTQGPLGQVFSRKSWDDEWVVEYRFSSSSLVPGETYTVSVVPVLGDSGESARTLTLKLLHLNLGLGWFIDESTGKGYIMNVLS